MQTAAVEFLNELAAGRIDGAYAQTSDTFQQGQNREQFGEFLKRYPAFRKAKTHSFSGAAILRVSGVLQGQIRGRILADPKDLEFAMILVQEDGEWRVNALLVPSCPFQSPQFDTSKKYLLRVTVTILLALFWGNEMVSAFRLLLAR